MKRWLTVALLLSLVTAGRWAAAQEPLTPIIDAYPPSGQAPLTVLLSGTRSTGKWGGIGEIESWEWDFTYDGSTFSPEPSLVANATVAYTFDRPGSHTVRLRITDTPNQGGPREAFTEVVIEVSESTRDPAERSVYPPGAWGAGINEVWASDEQLAAAAGYVQPVDQAFMQWAQVEPDAHGSYDWSRLDEKLAAAAAGDHRVAVQVNSELPGWVLGHIAQTGTARGMPSPQFWDPDYIAYYEALIAELGAHIAASPHGDRVLYVRQQYNAVHTETTHYDGTVNGDALGTWVDNPAWIWPADGHRYEVEWTEEIALDYERRIIAKFLDTFGPLGIGVTLRAVSSHLPEAERLAYYEGGDPAAWLLLTNNRYGIWDGGEQHTREFLVMRCLGARGFEETWSDSAARIAEHNPELSPGQDIYGVTLRVLDNGLPYIGIYGSDLALAADDVEFQGAFAFANRYAGWHLYPRSAPGAWLVLGRFEGSTDWRRLHTLARDNWGMFLRQNDPASTSTPTSLVGDPSCRFGLMARRLDAPATFDLDDSFAAAVDDLQVELQVTYLDGSGTIAVAVDQAGTLVDLAEAPGATDHQGWRTATYLITDPAFTGGPDGQSDIALSPVTGAPVVHLLELLRTDTPADGSGGAGPGDGGAGPGSSGAGDTEGGSGCGCATRPAVSPGAALALSLLILAGVARRRRRGEHCC